MAKFVRLTTFRGEEVYVNVELVTYVLASERSPGKTLIQFGPEGSGVLVEGEAVDVIKILRPTKPSPTAASGTYTRS